MKKFFNFIKLLLIISILLTCSSCKKIDYYSQTDNYISATGKVQSIKYSEDCSVLYFELSELIPSFDDNCFKIVGENTNIVRKNGVDNLVEIGSYVSFITAPRYFGDGFVFPIVSLSAKEEVLLDFEQGLSNFLKWLKT